MQLLEFVIAVAVMYSGEIVLTGTSRQVLKKPKHPYAHGLLSSIPKLSLPSLPVAMEGRPPMPGEKKLMVALLLSVANLPMKNVSLSLPNYWRLILTNM